MAISFTLLFIQLFIYSEIALGMEICIQDMQFSFHFFSSNIPNFEMINKKITIIQSNSSMKIRIEQIWLWHD